LKDSRQDQDEIDETKYSREEELSSKKNSFVGKSKAQVEIKIDPSMDPEKLDKLLGVLKKYGQI
jgi:hypothetical protein